VYDNDSVLFTSNIDGLYLTLELHSNNVNSAGEWFDLVINEVGTIPYDLNKYNYGKINGIRYFPDISQTNNTDIVYDNDSVLFTSNIDGLYLTLKLHSNNVNSAGEWFDLVLNEVGTIPYDLNKPLVSGVTYPMERSQNRSDFNDSATLFSETAADNINSLYQSVWYTYQTCCGNTDYGLVTEGTIITTIDAGSVTDTNITY
jgi:hypothetical protein